MMYESTLPGWLLLALPVTIFPGQPRFPMTTLGRPPSPSASPELQPHVSSCSPTYPAAAQTHSPGVPRPPALHCFHQAPSLPQCSLLMFSV